MSSSIFYLKLVDYAAVLSWKQHVGYVWESLSPNPPTLLTENYNTFSSWDTCKEKESRLLGLLPWRSSHRQNLTIIIIIIIIVVVVVIIVIIILIIIVFIIIIIINHQH